MGQWIDFQQTVNQRLLREDLGILPLRGQKSTA